MPPRYGLATLLAAALAAALGAVAACSGSSGSMDGGLDGGGDARVDVRPPGDATREGASDAPVDARDAAPPDAGPGPALIELSLSTGPLDAGVPATLFPAFSPGINDYYVRCAKGTNSFELSMAATPGATSRLTKPTSSPAVRSQTLHVDVGEGLAIVAVAQRGPTSVEYWVRCLPHDFPAMKWTPHADAGAPTPGYYLLANQTQGSGASGYAMILDGNGVPVWFLNDSGGGIYVDVDDIAPGTLSFLLYPQNPGQIGIHTLAPPTTAYIAPNVGLDISRHELRQLSNGHYLVIVPPNLYGVDMSGTKVTFTDGGTIPLGPSMTIQDCEIVEFDTSGNVWSTWTASDHMDVAKETVAPLLAGIESDGGLVLDPIHCNSIDLDPNTENGMLVSAKCTDSVSYVDRTTKRILWKMGGKPYSKDGATLVPVDDPFHSQHDARFQPGWSTSCSGGTGQISVFDDQTTTMKPARGAIYDVTVAPQEAGAPLDAGDAGGAVDSGAIDCGLSGAVTAATLHSQDRGTHNSSGMGSFRVLADGSRVIGWGQDNVPDLVFTEIDGNRDVLDFYFTQGFTSYRVVKVPTTTFVLETLRETAGQ